MPNYYRPWTLALLAWFWAPARPQRGEQWLGWDCRALPASHQFRIIGVEPTRRPVLSRSVLVAGLGQRLVVLGLGDGAHDLAFDTVLTEPERITSLAVMERDPGAKSGSVAVCAGVSWHGTVHAGPRQIIVEDTVLGWQQSDVSSLSSMTCRCPPHGRYGSITAHRSPPPPPSPWLGTCRHAASRHPGGHLGRLPATALPGRPAGAAPGPPRQSPAQPQRQVHSS